MVHVSGELGLPEALLATSFESWAEQLPIPLGSAQHERLGRAWKLAEEAGAGQPRDSGESCFDHARAVAAIVAGLRLDTDTVAAGLLHDLPALPGYDRARLVAAVGDDVASLVEGVARVGVISTLHGRNRGETPAVQAEALRKMLLAMVRDVRVVFLVLAERLHDMRTLKHRPAEDRRRVARESMDLYAPLANRLGIWQMKWELEDLSFRFLDPDSYQRVARMLAERRVDRERYIEQVRGRLAEALEDAGIPAEITGRPKHLYSIWRKMQRKQLGIDQLFDIRALRVLVDTVAQCYAALGVVHALWQPIPREFDDYIASPKENDYRSLHTAVVGPEGRTLEVQIRTHDMHRQAELGIAAHWRYKEGARPDPDFDQKVIWLRQLLEWGRDEGASDELLERFRSEVFEDRVYVVTPRGDVIDLPRGATPLDFAYHVHSDIGHRCRGARVRGRMVPLNHPLETGDQVEVLTAREPKPSRDWLNPGLGYLVTGRARAKVRTWFRQQDQERNIADGRALLDRELHRLGLGEVPLEQLVERSRFQSVHELLAAVGRGEVTGAQIAGWLRERVFPERESAVVPARPRGVRTGGSDDVVVEGVGNLLTRFARCCRPAPGDPIVGFVTQGQGVTIHRTGCANLEHLEESAPERIIDVGWAPRTEARYCVDLVVDAVDRPGLVRDVTTLVNGDGVGLLGINTRTDPGTQSTRISMTLEVRDVSQLSQLIHRIGSIRNVRDVRRRTD